MNEPFIFETGCSTGDKIAVSEIRSDIINIYPSGFCTDLCTGPVLTEPGFAPLFFEFDIPNILPPPACQCPPKFTITGTGTIIEHGTDCTRPVYSRIFHLTIPPPSTADCCINENEVRVEYELNLPCMPFHLNMKGVYETCSLVDIGVGQLIAVYSQDGVITTAETIVITLYIRNGETGERYRPIVFELEVTEGYTHVDIFSAWVDHLNNEEFSEDIYATIDTHTGVNTVTIVCKNENILLEVISSNSSLIASTEFSTAIGKRLDCSYGDPTEFPPAGGVDCAPDCSFVLNIPFRKVRCPFGMRVTGTMIMAPICAGGGMSKELYLSCPWDPHIDVSTVTEPCYCKFVYSYMFVIPRGVFLL